LCFCEERESEMVNMLDLDGNAFGAHRVLEPAGALPQAALKLDNDVDVVWRNEILADVTALNVDSASFTQLKRAAGGDNARLASSILEIVDTRGKLVNPVTGSGGVFTGTVLAVGDSVAGRAKPGDEVISLVSLTLTPLRIARIKDIDQATDRVEVEARAVLFESGHFIEMPTDMPAPLALAVVDVCGAPARTAEMVRPGETVAIIGAGGKAGMLSAQVAREKAGAAGMVIGIDHPDGNLGLLESLDLCDEHLALDAKDALAVNERVAYVTGGRMADLVINCVNVPDTEMASILACADGGRVYFFGMATSFAKAALGAEGVARDVQMIIGNGFSRSHAECALDLMRKNPELRALFEKKYAGLEN
jgi:L-erythro-3,5-diaminohexanoate dehydrogenase